MVDDVSKFDKLWIIESLPPGDLRTGLKLYEEEALQAQRRHPQLKVKFVAVCNTTEIQETLTRVRDDTNITGSYRVGHKG